MQNMLFSIQQNMEAADKQFLFTFLCTSAADNMNTAEENLTYIKKKH